MSTRFKNTLLAGIDVSGLMTVSYGIAKPHDDLHFLYSAYGLCDNWEVRAYSTVESYQSLDPIKCDNDGQFYPYFKFVFKS